MAKVTFVFLRSIFISLVHSNIALRLSLPVVVLFIGTKPRNSLNVSKLLKTSQIIISKWAVSVASVLSSKQIFKTLKYVSFDDTLYS